MFVVGSERTPGLKVQSTSNPITCIAGKKMGRSGAAHFPANCLSQQQSAAWP